MKNSLKSTLKGALLAVAAAAVVNSAQAQTTTYVSLAGAYQQGDLLAGFTTGGGNDLIVNLGLASDVLVSGNAWDLNSYLPANLVGLNNVTWGVVGVSPAGAGNLVYSTVPTGLTPNTVGNGSAFNTIKTQVGGLGSDLNGTTGFGTPAASLLGNASWNGGTVVGGTGTWLNNYSSPNDTIISGQFMSEDFYSTAYNHGAQSQLLTFNLASYGGDAILSYGVAPVPEPSTSALFLCSTGGLFLVALRRKLPHKA